MGAAHAADQSWPADNPKFGHLRTPPPMTRRSPAPSVISNRRERINWDVETAFSGGEVLDQPDADVPGIDPAGGGADDLMVRATVCTRAVFRHHRHTGLPPPRKRKRPGVGKHPQAVGGFINISGAKYSTATVTAQRVIEITIRRVGQRERRVAADSYDQRSVTPPGEPRASAHPTLLLREAIP
jgi:hypothetical protein